MVAALTEDRGFGLLIDLLVALVLISYALSGYRRGLLRSVSSLLGFLGGGALGIWLVPRAESVLTDTAPSLRAVSEVAALRLVLVLAFLLLMALLGQWLGSLLGARLRQGVRSRDGRRLDAWAGGVVVLLTAAMVLWFVASGVRAATPTPLAGAVGRSVLLTRIDAAMPETAGRMVASLRKVLAAQGFPQVFDGLRREPITTVAPPGSADAQTLGLQSLALSVVRIDSEARACGTTVGGSGWVLAPERVVTNAHVVAGSTRPQVTTVGQSGLTSRVVLFDPERDLAVLVVPGLKAPALEPGGVLSSGADAAVAGHPLGGSYAVEPARVRDVIRASGRDIQGKKSVVREVYSLRTAVQPGNSGGPMVDLSGRVVGIIFARSVDDVSTGYALTLAEAADDLRRGLTLGEPVETGPCLRS